MLNRGHSVIVILIGSTDSRKEIENSLKTIHSYDVISGKRERPVIAAYYQNSESTPRGAVDENVVSTLVALSVMMSGENRELDTADITNFLNYPAVTSFRPKLTHLEFYTGNISPAKNHLLIAALTLADDDSSTSVGQSVEYQAVGYVSEDAKKCMKTKFPLHAALVDGGFHAIADDLHNRLKSIDEVRATYKERSVAGKDVHDSATSDGLVL